MFVLFATPNTKTHLVLHVPVDTQLLLLALLIARPALSSIPIA